MTDGLPIPPEKLLGEAGWLRLLAVSLAGSGSADDLAQEAWLRALQQPPGRIHGLRPWLATVTRRAWRRGKRDGIARLRRERAAARPEAAPSTAELAARASLHRTVVDAVLSLDEPGRSTILLRFFDGRPPREIARLHGVPVETVRTRLRRALAVLRARLDRDLGGRESWVTAVAPVFGGLLMSTKSKFAVAAACALLLAIGIGVAWWSFDGSKDAEELAIDPMPGRPPAAAGSSSAAGAAAMTAPSAPAAESTPDPAEARVPAQATPVRFVVHVSDERGDDVAGAAVILTSGKDASATTDARGEAAFDADEPRVATIRTAARGFADAVVERAAITGGARIQVDLVPLATLRVRVEDGQGAGIPGARVDLGSHPLFTGFDYPGFERHVQMTGDDGTATFTGISARQWFVRVHAAGFLDAVSSPGSRDDPRVGPADATIVLKRGTELTVRFQNSVTGAPVAGVWASISPEVEKRHRSYMTASDEAGIILIGRATEATTRIELDGNVFAERNETFVPPEQTTVTIRMSDRLPVTCLVTREDRTPVTAALLEYDNPRRIHPVAASDGRYPVEDQGHATSPYFRFVVPGGTSPWRRIVTWKAETTAIVYGSITIEGQVVTSEGEAVPGALIVIDPLPVLNLSMLAKDVVSARTDERGRFSASVGGDPYHLVEVATSIGPCARQFVAAKRSKLTDWNPSGDVKPALPIAQADESGVCDVGRIVVPTRTGDLHVTVGSVRPGLSEVVATPLGAAKDLFPARRAPIRTNLTASFAALPEGDYDVGVVPGRGSAYIPGLFGVWGTRATVVSGRVTEVNVRK